MLEALAARGAAVSGDESAVLGAAGYVGGELLRLLRSIRMSPGSRRPPQPGGQGIGDIHPAAGVLTDATFSGE